MRQMRGRPLSQCHPLTRRMCQGHRRCLSSRTFKSARRSSSLRCGARNLHSLRMGSAGACARCCTGSWAPHVILNVIWQHSIRASWRTSHTSEWTTPAFLHSFKVEQLRMFRVGCTKSWALRTSRCLRLLGVATGTGAVLTVAMHAQAGKCRHRFMGNLPRELAEEHNTSVNGCQLHFP